MKRFMHYIADDLEEIKGYARWEWLVIPNGIMKFTALLKSHAELNRRYPEDVNDADD